MRKFIHIKLLGLISYLMIVACSTDLYETYEKYIDENTPVSVGRPLEIASKPGNERLIFNILVNSDPKIKKGVIEWNNGQEVMEFEVDRNNLGRDVKMVELKLSEGNYKFRLHFEDDKGNKSLYTEHSATVYGEKYKSSIFNRPLESISVFSDKAIIYFGDPGTGLVRTEIFYTNQEGILDTAVVEKTVNEVEIANYQLGDEFQYVSYYLPERNAIDTFETIIALDTFPDKFKLDNSIIQVISLENDFKGDAHGGSLDKLFNGKTGNGDWYHSHSDELIPYHFTFDLGLTTSISDFRIYPRQDCCYERSPKKFQLWGIEDTTNAATSLPVSDAEWIEESKAKGWKQLVDNIQTGDQPTDGSPIDVKILKTDEIRFVRFVFVEAWKEGSTHLSEFEFWSDKR